ncbi:LysM peptidoglycan-binding domain-containing protein [Gorillibacterium sp. sgz500922]
MIWSVAQRFKLTVAGLQKLNHISDAETRRLAVGREIRLH